MFCLYFFFNDPPTTEIYTLSLHDALPISDRVDGVVGEIGRDLHEQRLRAPLRALGHERVEDRTRGRGDRKSTRLNSSHPSISYAVFCLKKKKNPNSIAHHIYLPT